MLKRPILENQSSHYMIQVNLSTFELYFAKNQILCFSSSKSLPTPTISTTIPVELIPSSWGGKERNGTNYF